ncbi:ATP-binding cassette domain-containing protein, partial [Klebsiella aerogenes]|uniref:ATP-binding cassette domain-containing protein n=1 Tax=Klebsiella aerogenes TaxID=548 RepID=UPI0034DB0F04
MIFEQVGFRHSGNSDWALENIDLVIPKGARIGFVGSTGSGKSTMLDLLMLLLEPTAGKILVDRQEVANEEQRRAWQRNIA